MAVMVAEGVDAGVPWHFGDPMREQRRLEAGEGAVDLSHRGVLTVTGPDRLGWLHSLTTQHLTALTPGTGTTAYVLSPQGHIEHALYGVDDGETFWVHTEPGAAAAAAGWLDSMRFMMRVEVTDRTSDYAVVWQPGTPSDERAVTRAALRTPLEASVQLLSYPRPREFWRESVYSTRKPVLYAVRPRFAAQADALAARHPDATVAIFEGAGHALFVDEAARFNALLDDFLARKLGWR